MPSSSPPSPSPACWRGIAGHMWAMTEAFISPELLGWHRSAEGLLAILLGGIGALHGPIVGAFVWVGLGEAAQIADRTAASHPGPGHSCRRAGAAAGPRRAGTVPHAAMCRRPKRSSHDACDAGIRPVQTLRRPRRGRPRRPRAPTRRAARRHRPQRRRQEHADQPALRRTDPDRRQHPTPRHGRRRAGPPGASPAPGSAARSSAPTCCAT